ncbi:D-2-hydroxyacid dehydrogenase [soil metagenome]
MTLNAKPVITVLCAHADDRPPHLTPVEARAEVRYTDAAGLADAVQGAGALLLWDFFSTAVEDVWSQADALRWIHVAAAGVDKLLFDDLVESDVLLTNARGVFDRPIAEFVLASILAQVKGLYASHDLQRERRWRHRETATINGTNALVVGTGAIGRETARLLTAVGMNVRGAGRTARSGDRDFGDVVASDELAAHVGWADHVVLATPLTDQTRGLVDGSVLAAMKPSAHLINIARGGVVDEPALIRALTGGEIAAASLDVFATEPLPADHPLWSLSGMVVTPHMAGDAAGWLDTLAQQFVDNAMRWLDGKQLFNVVDPRLGFVPAGPQEEAT